MADIYNSDETELAMDLIATARVVTKSEATGNSALLQPENREWATAIECVDAVGLVLYIFGLSVKFLVK